MKKTISALTAAAALSGTVFGFGTAIPAKAAAQTNPPAEETTSSSAKLVKNLYNTAFTGEMPQQVQGLTINKSTKGDVHAKMGEPERPLEETICLIYTAGIWEIPATAFPITKT